jgi:hypothetical protein
MRRVSGQVPPRNHRQQHFTGVSGHLGGQLRIGQAHRISIADHRRHATTGGSHPKCSWIWRTAIDPSPTADATLFTEPLRTSPAANTPGWLVSSIPGWRRGRRRFSPSPSEYSAAGPVGMKPWSSSSMVPASHALLGTAPMKTNSARVSIDWRSHFTMSLVLVPHAAHATRPQSCHRLGPLDLPFKSKRYRHGSVAVPVVSRGGFIAVGSSRQRAQP